MMPKRIQMRRTKGWRKPEGAIYVGRPSKWGNPWKVGEVVNSIMPADCRSWFGRLSGEIITDNKDAVEMYRRWLVDIENRNCGLEVKSLRGHDLACWCPLDKPCHADVLLEIANK